MSLAVSNGDVTLWIGLIAFGGQAEQLLRYAKGDIVSVTGRLELNVWTTKEGVERKDLQCVVARIIGARPKPKTYSRTEDSPASYRPWMNQSRLADFTAPQPRRPT